MNLKVGDKVIRTIFGWGGTEDGQIYTVIRVGLHGMICLDGYLMEYDSVFFQKVDDYRVDKILAKYGA